MLFEEFLEEYRGFLCVYTAHIYGFDHICKYMHLYLNYWIYRLFRNSNEHSIKTLYVNLSFIPFYAYKGQKIVPVFQHCPQLLQALLITFFTTSIIKAMAPQMAPWLLHCSFYDRILNVKEALNLMRWRFFKRLLLVNDLTNLWKCRYLGINFEA